LYRRADTESREFADDLGLIRYSSLADRSGPMDDADPIAFADVEVLADNQLVVLCLVNGRIVTIPLGRMLPGTTVRRYGERGTLVLTRQLATMLRLTWEGTVGRPEIRGRSGRG
jgi:hypothetical protein